MSEINNYQPFGKAWEQEVLKHSKKNIVSILKERCLKVQELQEQLEQATNFNCICTPEQTTGYTTTNLCNCCGRPLSRI